MNLNWNEEWIVHKLFSRRIEDEAGLGFPTRMCIYNYGHLTQPEIDGYITFTVSDFEKFSRLASRWHNETDFLSSPSRITNNDIYMEIISMGSAIIPLILQDLKARGGDWYRALRILSNENPILEESRGDVEQIKSAWLQWGRDRGYIA